MEEIVQLIEARIKATGYPKEIDGLEFYKDISAESEEKENGSYLFLVKKSDTLIYEGSMTVFEDEFDLHYVDIIDDGQTYHVDFDAE